MRTALTSRLREGRARLDLELRASRARRYFSPAMFGLYTTLVPRLRTHVSGKVLDAGCGTMPFRRVLEELADEVHALDIERKVPEVELVADVQDLSAIPAESYDAVLATEVLEHVPRPERALAEIHRILRPGGKLILTVPYLSRLHDEPFDYFRYTRHGLGLLLESGGFRVIEITPTGSLFSFLGHQFSSALVGGTWRIPIVKWIVFWVNAALCTLPCQALDRWLPIREKMPLGYAAVGVKPPAP